MSIASKLTVGFLAAACMATLSAAEEVILKVEKPEDFAQESSVKATENGTLFFKGAGTVLLSKKKIKIDPAKQYRISGEFCLKGGRPVTLYLGFAPSDKNDVPIAPCALRGKNDTLTTVAENAKEDDKVIKVKDASKWDTKSQNSYIAFNAAEDYSDMPNRNTVATAAPNARKVGEVWEIALKTPLKADVAAGTPVRQQFGGALYIYAAGSFKTVGVWTARSGVATGITGIGTACNKFWKGTDSVQIVIMTTGGDRLSETEFRNVKVEEVKKGFSLIPQSCKKAEEVKKAPAEKAAPEKAASEKTAPAEKAAPKEKR